jgi:hypothetical protein
VRASGVPCLLGQIFHLADIGFCNYFFEAWTLCERQQERQPGVLASSIGNRPKPFVVFIEAKKNTTIPSKKEAKEKDAI